jgi:riboflavin synthase
MFSGIVTDIGEVVAVERAGDTIFTIRTGYDTASIPVGASIAHDGVCLTVAETAGDRYRVTASAETLGCTTLGEWQVGTAVNLERSLRLGEAVDGHLVYGHVDGTGTILDVRPEGDSVRYVFQAPPALADFIAPKGSIAIDGVSLTVNAVEDTADGGCRFGVNIIPHTRSCTTFRTSSAGRRVNFEIDMLARYTARLLRARPIPG